MTSAEENRIIVHRVVREWVGFRVVNKEAGRLASEREEGEVRDGRRKLVEEEGREEGREEEVEDWRKRNTQPHPPSQPNAPEIWRRRRRFQRRNTDDRRVVVGGEVTAVPNGLTFGRDGHLYVTTEEALLRLRINTTGIVNSSSPFPSSPPAPLTGI